MTAEKINSATREILSAVGAAVTTYGILDGQMVATWSGAALSITMVVWAITHHAGKSVLGTLLRKLVSSASGVAVAYGLTPEKAEALAGVLLVVGSLYFGNKKAGGGVNDNLLKLLAMVAVASALISLPSCAALKLITFTPDGCIKSSFDGKHGTFDVLACYENNPGLDGKRDIERYVIAGKNNDGQGVRATQYVLGVRATQFEYQAPDGGWIAWSTKSGISLGVLPEVVKEVAAPPQVVATK